MEFTYLPEENAEDYDIMIDVTCYILCYTINSSTTYPFLQFMLIKSFGELYLPFIKIGKESKNYKEQILMIIKDNLELINCDGKSINNSMFKGFIDINGIPFALVNVTDIDTQFLNLGQISPLWFVLPSEIINNRTVCNVPINEYTSHIFTTNPNLSLLYNSITNEKYNIPECVYTIGQNSTVDFNAIFGPKKQQIPQMLDVNLTNKYYWFYTSLNEAINTINNYKLDENTKSTNQKFGINRYALFHDNLTLKHNSIDVTDLFIEENISISISNKLGEVIIITTNYDDFYPLSFDKLSY
jgi:hypothetical protein